MHLKNIRDISTHETKTWNKKLEAIISHIALTKRGNSTYIEGSGKCGKLHEYTIEKNDHSLCLCSPMFISYVATNWTFSFSYIVQLTFHKFTVDLYFIWIIPDNLIKLGNLHIPEWVNNYLNLLFEEYFRPLIFYLANKQFYTDSLYTCEWVNKPVTLLPSVISSLSLHLLHNKKENLIHIY